MANLCLRVSSYADLVHTVHWVKYILGLSLTSLTCYGSVWLFSDFPVYLRPDYALVETDGRILRPTMSELQAHVMMRYAEAHDKLVPYT